LVALFCNEGVVILRLSFIKEKLVELLFELKNIAADGDERSRDDALDGEFLKLDLE
jgi:hypothetical protein